MSIDDVAFETRIRRAFIERLEADDYSQFASTTYARSFLTLYSRFLEVDVDEALHFFAGGDEIHLGSRGFPAALPEIESVTVPKPPKGGEKSAAGIMPPSAERESPGIAPVFLGVIVLLLISAIPILWFIGKDAGSIDEATDKAKGMVESANQAVAADGETTTPGETELPTSGGIKRPRPSASEMAIAAPWLQAEAESAAAAANSEETLPEGNTNVPEPTEIAQETTQPAATEESTTPEPPAAGDPLTASSSTPSESAFGGAAPLEGVPGPIARLTGSLPSLPGNRKRTPRNRSQASQDNTPIVAEASLPPASPVTEAESDSPPAPAEVEESEPEDDPDSAPATPIPTNGPLRAVPMTVAQPIAIPTEDTESEEEDENTETPSDEDGSGEVSESSSAELVSGNNNG